MRARCSLVHLVERLRERGFHFLDSQYGNPHIYSFGAYDVEEHEYLNMLAKAMKGTAALVRASRYLAREITLTCANCRCPSRPE
jgi:Leu/Phe-tRNA-protein transferase